ncbi:AAA domain protein [Collimonas fungivorans]|uniref:AAA domain protein n=1 Tax=Collimonas fungivorans TaxID=158899 RepID=A0A127P5U8_9BURK|nr:AAA family ATPase [Collimonas fungivorans]AMO93196.1 AAA domain protein [Collimonas fungivorans]
MAMSIHDPYKGNILVQGLGPILSREEALIALLHLPPFPGDMKGVPVQIRLHYLMSLRDLHIPFLETAQLQTTMDLMTRQGYRYRDPMFAETWRMMGGEVGTRKPIRAPASAAVVVGYSGTGKTEAVLRGLNTNPQQVIFHENFPHMTRGLSQVVWLSTDVPASGRTADLASNLMMAWDHVVRGERFAHSLAKNRRNGAQMLDEWCQVASSHFLGILHLDEVQNFFKIQSLERRRKQKENDTGPELSIVEDACLKGILNLTNNWQIPLVLSGTPDGVGALTKRMSTTQRLVTAGYHPLTYFVDAKDPRFCEVFFPKLCKYQYVTKKLPVSDKFGEKIIELTGGIPRIMIALWIAAHRVAFERSTDDLIVEDFIKASDTYLAPVGPAVAALRSNDPKRMARYEDVMLRDDGFWATFWTPVH